MKTLSALILFFSLSPSFAYAQDAPVVEIRSAIGASTYLHGDLDYTAPIAAVSLRVGTRNIAFEPEFLYAWHEESTTFGSGSVHQTSRDTFTSIGFNVVRRWPGQVTPYVGGGVGVFTERYRSTTVSPVFGTTVFDRTRGPRGGLQVLGGADFRVTSRIAGFGQGRFEGRSMQDPGGGSVWQVMGGVSVRIY